MPPPAPIEHLNGNLYKIFGGGGNTLVLNVNVAYQQLSGETVTTNFGAPLPATDKHKASDPADTGWPPAPPGN